MTTKNQTSCGFQGWLQTEKMAACQEQSTNIITSYVMWYINKHLLDSLFLLCWWITLKLKKELNNFQLFVHKMTRQSLKLGRFMTNQVANMFGHVQWLSVTSTPGIK